MSATKIKKPPFIPCKSAAPQPTAAQTAFLRELMRGRLVCSSITPKGLRKAVLQTPSGRPVEGAEALRRTMVDSCAHKGWLEKVASDEMSTTFRLSDAGRTAIKSVAKSVRAAARAVKSL